MTGYGLTKQLSTFSVAVAEVTYAQILPWPESQDFAATDKVDFSVAKVTTAYILHWPRSLTSQILQKKSPTMQILQGPKSQTTEILQWSKSQKI